MSMRSLVVVLILALTSMDAAAGFFQRLQERRAEKEKEESSQVQVGTYREFTVDGRDRQYILRLPRKGDSSGPLPLIIVLHGTYGTGEKMQEQLGFDALADERGFMVAYPDAFRKSKLRSRTTRWNDGRGTLESTELGVDDVRFIQSMIEDIAKHAPLDRGRIYATGGSNGGIMTYRLGCELKGTFAALAPVIANIAVSLKDSCRPEPGVSLLTINGAADPVVPLNGGTICRDISKFMCEGGEVISRQESVGKFAAANGCSLTPSTVRLTAAANDGTSVDKLTYAGCNGGAEVVSYVVHGMGHSWPPRAPEGGKKLGDTTRNLDATSVIVDFFLRHRR